MLLEMPSKKVLKTIEPVCRTLVVTHVRFVILVTGRPTFHRRSTVVASSAASLPGGVEWDADFGSSWRIFEGWHSVIDSRSLSLIFFYVVLH